MKDKEARRERTRDAPRAPRAHPRRGEERAGAAGPRAALAAARRGSDPVHPAITGAALATCAAAWASFASTFHCPYSGLTHLVLGHILPIAALSAIGTVIIARVVALRSPRG